MIPATEMLEIITVLWLLVGATLAALVLGACAGNLSVALRQVIGNSVNFVMMSVLIVVVMAWVVITGPFWLGVLIFQDDPPLDDNDDDYLKRQW
jgi:hypothetical protein